MMCFIGNDGNQGFLVFSPMLNSLTLDNSKIVTNWIAFIFLPEKYCNKLELTTSDLS